MTRRRSFLERARDTDDELDQRPAVNCRAIAQDPDPVPPPVAPPELDAARALSPAGPPPGLAALAGAEIGNQPEPDEDDQPW